MLDGSRTDAVATPGRVVRTRLYFTSESHLQTLLNVLRFPLPGAPSVITSEGARQLAETPELCYLTQVGQCPPPVVAPSRFSDFEAPRDTPPPPLPRRSSSASGRTTRATHATAGASASRSSSLPVPTRCCTPLAARAA